MKDPVHIFGYGRGFHLPCRGSLEAREPCLWAGLTIGLRRNEWGLPDVPLPENAHARVDGNFGERAGLCRLRRNRDLAQIAGRKIV